MRADRGFVLVVALLVMAAVAVVVLGASFTALVDSQTSGRQQGANSAYYVAMAGLNQYKTLLLRQLARQYEDTGAGWCESPLSGGIKDPDGTVILTPGQTSPPHVIGPGSYQVTYELSGLYIVLTSVGTVGDDRTVLQLVTTSGDGPASAWDNALMASGALAGKGHNNGNVSVFGSIHIVGDYEVDEYITDLEMTGTLGVYDHYVGEGANSSVLDQMRTLVSTIPETLCTRIKSKTGDVIIQGGSVQLGTPQHPIQSIHMRDGAVYRKNGSNLTLLENHLDPGLTQIELRFPEDYGMVSPYEAWDIPLPRLDPEFPNDVTPAFTLTAETCPALAGDLSDGVLTLPPALTFTCGDPELGIAWDGTVLTVNGAINLGALDVRVTGDLKYAGKGRLRQGASATDSARTFYVGGTVTPVGATYLEQDVLVLETAGSVEFDVSGNNPPVAMLIYAQEDAIFSKQVLVAGAVIADEYTLKKQVPSIAYHPLVRDIAEELELPGTCTGEQCNPGALADISIERRDTAAIE